MFLTTQGGKTFTAKTLSDCTARSKPGSTELLGQSHSTLLKVVLRGRRYLGAQLARY
jgi:hypothetical protein